MKILDKEEFRIKLEEINNLVEKKDYKGAMEVVDSIDWRRVKNVRTLCVVGEIYAANKRYEESKEIFLLAYHKAPIGKNILYRLIEISLKMGDIEEAMEYFDEFKEIAPNDNTRYVLKYKIFRAKKASLNEQIAILEEYKEKEFTEKWTYELAKLYYKAGNKEKCLEICDELILWFNEGTYVMKALDLKMRKDMQMELKEMHKSLGITFVYVTHDQEEALTLSDTIVVMSEGKIQQIGTPIDIYNEPINAFVADFIGESNILNGTMIHDKLVRFCGTEFECVDEGFGENVPVDVVIRPEDLYIFPVSDMAQLVGVVETSIFKGVHYEMTVMCGGYEFLVQDYHHFEVGAEVGLLVKPFDIHIMKKERICNTFEGKLLDATHVEFLGCNFECTPVEDIAADTNVKVEVDFEKVILQDNEEDGTLTGEVKFILYKGDHYHLTVLSDWDENVFVDTNDVWDDGDRVGITIPPDAIRIIKITD